MKYIILVSLVFSCFFVKVQSPPTAVEDYFLLDRMEYYSNTINLLENDFDSDNDSIQIYDLTQPKHGYFNTMTDSTIEYIYQTPLYFGLDSFNYRIVDKYDSLSISDWAKVIIDYSQDTTKMLCVDDFASTLGTITVSKNVLKNDLNFTDDSLILMVVKAPKSKGLAKVISDSTLHYTPSHRNLGGIDTVLYFLVEKNVNRIRFGGRFIVDVKNIHSYDSLNINNINTGINSFGLFFTNADFYEYNNQLNSGAPHFEVPKGSGLHTLFSHSLWIGGQHGNDLHLAAERYKEWGSDFFSGPVSSNYDSLYNVNWNRVWKISKSDLYFHIQHWSDPDYKAIYAIESWPGNGDIDRGQAEFLAPFCDFNKDGIYNPYDGDYPSIRGDQAIFLILNDDKKEHSSSEGKKLGVEIHAMFYEFDQPKDSALFNTVFVHYDAFNRSERTYDSTYLGTFLDSNVGYARDDYVGCNIQGGYFYGYNGDNFDGKENERGYGFHPPAQSLNILAGPKMEDDGIDNPAWQCDEGINGINFGDGIIDNERLGLTSWLYFNNSSSNINGVPRYAKDYYNYMRAYWLDNTHVKYGGNGHPINGSNDIDSKFMFTASSDTCNWGTYGISANNDLWTEGIVGNTPHDRRSVGASGPFTFSAEEKIELDLAFVFARDFKGDNMDALLVLEERNKYLKDKVKKGELIYLSACDFSALDENNQGQGILFYPNPCHDFVYVKSEKTEASFEIKIFDLTGKLRARQTSTGENTTINLSHLEKGFYFLQTENGNIRKTAKLIKY
jgi:Secretion system C-terminal sorting domain/Bacterial Ig domain